jgi:hypothetical protein
VTAPPAQPLQRPANETGMQAGTLEKVLHLLDVARVLRL